ncbi:MAG: hypothetical protein WBA16_12315 [Nonlabens sp.]
MIDFKCTFYKKVTLIFFTIIIIQGCFSRSSQNANDTFTYWLKMDPPKEVRVINGEFYQSPHFTLEYELFLEFMVKKTWWESLVATNQLIHTAFQFLPESIDAPAWFTPDGTFELYKSAVTYDRSFYYVNKQSGLCYVYESLGM